MRNKPIPSFLGTSLGKGRNSAFTLVELIIVITILAILATIGFMSYQSYTTDARDSNRITTIKEISNGLDITFVKKAAYPMPDGIVATGTINGTIYAYRGTIGDTISQTLRMTKAVDPATKDEYIYGVNGDKTQYQIASLLESNTIVQATSITDTTYADLGVVAKVNGNYPGYFKYSSGSETWISNIPSLLWNNTGGVNLLSTTTQFVVDRKTNLPYKLSTGSDIGTKNANTIIQEITGTGVATLTGVNITSVTNSNISSTFSGVLLASFGGDIAKVTSNVIGGSVASASIPRDTQAPTGGDFTIPSTASSTGITLTVTCPTDNVSTGTGIQIAYGNTASPTNWTACISSISHTLTTGDGAKTVYVRFKDSAGNMTGDVSKNTSLSTLGENLLTSSEQQNLVNSVGSNWTKCYDRSINGANQIQDYCNGATDYLVVWKQQSANAYASYVGNGQCLPLGNCNGSDFMNNANKLKFINLTNNITNTCNYSGMMHWGSSTNTTWQNHGLVYCFHMGNGFSLDNLWTDNEIVYQIYCDSGQYPGPCTNWAPAWSSGGRPGVSLVNYIMYKR